MLQIVDIPPVHAVTVNIVEGAYGGRGRRHGSESVAGRVRRRRLPILLASRPHVKVTIVIATDDDLLGMWQRLQPVDGGLDLEQTAIVAEIPGMDQQIPVRDRDLTGIRQAMGVGNTDHANRTRAGRRRVGRAS